MEINMLWSTENTCIALTKSIYYTIISFTDYMSRKTTLKSTAWWLSKQFACFSFAGVIAIYFFQMSKNYSFWLSLRGKGFICHYYENCNNHYKYDGEIGQHLY